MSSRRVRRRISKRWHIAPLPPGEDQPGDDHDQHDLQQQTEDRGKARHATEKSVPEQQAKQTCAEEANGKPAEQSAAEQARTHFSLADGRGAAGLCHRKLVREEATPFIGLAVDLVRRFLPKGTDQRTCLAAAIWLIGQCSVFMRNREQFAAPPVGLALDKSAVEQLAQLVSHWAAAALAQPS